MKLAAKLFYWYAFFFAKVKFKRIHMLLINLGLRGLGIYNYQNLNISGESSFLKNYLNKIENPVVFDIGANKGGYTKLCKNINKNVKIFCFEPHPKTFISLQENIDNNQITFINKALSDKNGKLLLYDYKEKDGSSHASLYANVIEKVHGKESICHKVDVTTVDNIVNEFNIRKIDLLKIDVEGNELNVLKGSKEALNNGIIEAVQFEFTQINSTSRIFMKDFFDILKEKYTINRLLPNELLPLKEYNSTMHEICGYQNIVALRKK